MKEMKIEKKDENNDGDDWINIIELNTRKLTNPKQTLQRENFCMRFKLERELCQLRKL
jgi:hypothetical protein